MNTNSFIVNIKTEDFYKDIEDDVEKRFDTSNYECNRPLRIGKNKKMIGLVKDELGGKIMIKFVALRPKTYSYLINDCNTTIKEAKGTKKCVIKRRIKFKDYKKCLLNNKTILKPQQKFKSEAQVNILKKLINKIADDKTLETFDRIKSYPYGISTGKVCKTDTK